LPQTFSVVLSAKSEKSLKKNAVTLPLYTILILFAFFIGFAAILQVPGLQGAEGDLALLRLTLQTFDPWFVGIVGGAGLLTALVPVSVMVMSGAVGLMTGFYKLIKPNSSDRQQLTVSKLFVLLIIVTAYVFTIFGGNALAILNIMSYGLITQLVPAMMFGFFRKRIMNAYGAIAGILTGVFLVLFNAVTSFQLADVFPGIPSVLNDINIGFVAIALNIFVGLTVSLIMNVFAMKSKVELAK
jgi:SSS family solute:Na+ symporter